MLDDNGGLAPGRDDVRVATNLFADPLYEPIDERGVAVDDSRLNGLNRRLTDRIARSDELDTPNLGSRLVQRSGCRFDAGTDGAAEVLPLGGDGIHRDGGSKIDDDGRLAGKHVAGGHRVGYAVGADLTRVVHLDCDAGPRSRLDHYRRKTEVPLGHLTKLLSQGRHYRADRHPGDLAREREAGEIEELTGDESELVRGSVRRRRHSPFMRQCVASKDAEMRLRVTY